MLNPRRWSGRRRLSWLWILVTALTALWAHIALSTGVFAGFFYFDYPLFLLQPVYAAHGLRPYVDYGFLYPPGPALLFGKLMHLGDPRQVQIAVALFNLAISVLCSAVVMRLARGQRLFAGGLALLCLGAFVPIVCIWLQIDPCPLSLTCLTLLLALAAFRRGSAALRWGLAAAAAATTLWRWERAFPAMILLACGATVLWIAAGVFRREALRVRRTATRLLATAMIGLAGAAAGFAAMALYGLTAPSWAAEKEFVFHLPLLVSSLRRVPVANPKMPFVQCGADLLAMLVLAWIAVTRRLPRGRILPGRLATIFVILAGPVALLPYSLHRPDGPHFLPVSAALIMVMIPARSFCARAARRGLAFAFCLVLLPVGAMAALEGLRLGAAPNGEVFHPSMERLTHACSALIPEGSRSLFVGEQAYSGYLMNAAVLYLAHPELRPATVFISDEPGIQNACAYGSRIANDLARAPRPLAVALDTTPWPDANLGVPVESCGKIEAELASLPAEQMGTCTIAGHVFKMETVR